jgi:hypothetical protein
METFLIAVGVVSIGGLLVRWVWSAARRAGKTRGSNAGAGHDGGVYAAGYYAAADHGDSGRLSGTDAGGDVSG